MWPLSSFGAREVVARKSDTNTLSSSSPTAQGLPVRDYKMGLHSCSCPNCNGPEQAPYLLRKNLVPFQGTLVNSGITASQPYIGHRPSFQLQKPLVAALSHLFLWLPLTQLAV